MRQYGLNFEGGALVTAVAASSPAERADIRAGDIVYALNDRLLTPNLSLLDLLWSEQPLAIISLLGWRQGRHYRALVVLEER